MPGVSHTAQLLTSGENVFTNSIALTGSRAAIFPGSFAASVRSPELPFFHRPDTRTKSAFLNCCATWFNTGTRTPYIFSAIYNEMGNNIFLPAAKRRLLEIIERLAKDGAGGIVLGCTEIPLMIKQPDCSIPVSDTAQIHAAAAVAFALET